MDILTWKDLDNTPKDNSTLYSCTIGVFDGVHLGHQTLIKKIRQQKNTKSMVVTFRENPVRILSPEIFKGNLTTLTEKLRILADLEVDLVLLIDFSHDFSTLSCKDFLDTLISRINIVYIALGENFHCGKNAETDSEGVKDIVSKRENIQLNVVHHFQHNNEIISSTRIRNAILSGNIGEASKMLGRPYSFTIPIWAEKDDSNVSVINKKILKKVLPPPGKYRVRYNKNGEDATGSVFITNREIVVKQLHLTGDESFEFLHPCNTSFTGEKLKDGKRMND